MDFKNVFLNINNKHEYIATRISLSLAQRGKVYSTFT